MQILFAVLVGLLAAGSPFLVLEGVKALQDNRTRSKLGDMPKAQADKMMGDGELKKSQFNKTLSAAWHDQRLAGKERPIMVPDKKKIKEMEAQGQTVTDENRPMKPLQDDGGNPVMENTAEKWDPRFDRFSDGSPDPILSRIYIDPGKGAPTKTRAYKILLTLSFLAGTIAFLTKIWVLLIIPVILSSVCLNKMMKNGKECLESNKLLWEKLDTIYSKNIQPFNDGESAKDFIQIIDWNAPGDDLYEANAKTFASENGISEELEKILPKIDKKTGRKIKPRRACFRDVPARMTIHFDANFMESGKDALMKHLNQNIGGGKVEWVAKRAVPQDDGSLLQVEGWDFDKMQVDVMTLPPLPSIAAVPEDLDETPWNIIRIGRTVDGEAVWDLSGQGWGLRPKKNPDGSIMRDETGMPVFPSSPNEPGAELDTIHHGSGAGITCPMALVPLDVNTLVWAIVDDDQSTGSESNEDPTNENGTSASSSTTEPVNEESLRPHEPIEMPQEQVDFF